MLRNENWWINQYKEKGALWIHDENSKRPHALLTSGNHSNGFFNSGIVTEHPQLLDMACHDLVQKLETHYLEALSDINRVVGPAMGAITIAHDIARWISDLGPGGCLCGYTEKETAEGSKLMVFKRTVIRSGERILPVEDVLTTGGSVELTATAITNAGGVVLPFVAVLVNRSGLTEVNGKKIVALIDRPMPMWAPEECPLCKIGSEAIKPKGAENWTRLNQTY